MNQLVDGQPAAFLMIFDLETIVAMGVAIKLAIIAQTGKSVSLLYK